ncbi:MAG: 4Fe-4S binding protein [Eubacteriaceae bacterium]|nr:4Fe-4S binding protein [Eubacteriaceae bacterium]
MKRTIINIDESKCVGCGLCISACHEGALKLIDGKARLISDSYCDGLGKCMPKCPTGAMTLEEKDAAEFDMKAAEVRKEKASEPAASACGCPGSQTKTIDRKPVADTTQGVQANYEKPVSQLGSWPVQIKLVPANAPYFNNSHLLVAADCTAFAYANIHADYMKNKVTIIGCPKLDSVDYSEKLADILKLNNIKSITVLRMSVPCCGGITNAVIDAMRSSGKMIPWQVVTVGTDGSILDV